MSYSYRLNIEGILFRLAEQHFKIASPLVGIVLDSAEEDGSDCSFRGFPTDEGLAEAVIAVIGWATTLESVTNLAWNQIIAPKIPEGKIRQLAISRLTTLEKIKEIIKTKSTNLASLEWWVHLNKLVKTRNKLIHYQETVKYQGFSFAPAISRELSEQNLLDFRFSVIEAIRLLGEISEISVSFVDGDYMLADVSG